MIKPVLIGSVAACIACISSASATEDTCAPLGLDKPALMELREDKFALGEVGTTDAFALELVACLGHPDPDLRDKIGYEGLSYLMREKLITYATIKAISTKLVEFLGTPDPDGFRQPFAALVLSEVARADRIDGIFSGEERTGLVSTAADYVRSITDYRGFDETEGWRHGVAHGADFLMQLTLNENLDKEQLLDIRNAVASQVMADSKHFYTYGEPERLARPVLFMARHEVFSEDEWTAWFETLSDPAPFESWGAVFFSQSGLARRHNLRAFALSIYANADASSNEVYKVLLPGALAILQKTA